MKLVSLLCEKVITVNDARVKEMTAGSVVKGGVRRKYRSESIGVAERWDLLRSLILRFNNNQRTSQRRPSRDELNSRIIDHRSAHIRASALVTGK